jgi:putative nucleotidyltransferase with HDIG domain
VATASGDRQPGRYRTTVDSDVPRVLRPIDGGGDAVRIARAIALIAGVREGREPAHAERVALLAGRIAEAMGLEPAAVRRCAVAGWLHDIGMVALPDAALSPVDPAAADHRTHAAIGAELVRRVDEVADAAAGVRHHHERWDGRGYPDGLAGGAIPVEARVVAAADAVAALVPTSRLDPRSRKQAAARLESEAGRSLDPLTVEAARAVLASEAADHGEYLRIA